MRHASNALLAAGLLAAAACSSGQGYDTSSATPETRTTTMGGTVATSAADLKTGMRQLWEDHIWWTRNFIISAAAGSADLDAVTQRLLRNQTDIGNAIKPYYGDAAGTQLTALLRGHITTAAQLVTAAKANNTSQVEDLNRRWQANSDSIADFLHAANPTNWPQDNLRTAMRMHLDLTLREATARLRGDWAADIAAFDEVHRQALHMADMLAEGIARQHPDRVSSR